jgi:hypothetical protein
MFQPTHTGLLNLDVKPWAEFFELESFVRPSKHKYRDRLRTNAAYYQANYLIVAAFTLLYVCYARPSFIITTLLSAGIGYCAKLYYSGQRRITRAHVQGYAVGVALLSLYSGRISLVAAAAFSLLLALLHATFRKPSLAQATTGTHFYGWREDAGSLG